MDLIVLAKEMDTSSGVIGIPLATNLAFLNSCLNPLLYVFVGKDFKKEVCKSILAAMETAFQEEEKRSQSYTKSVSTNTTQLWKLMCKAVNDTKNHKETILLQRKSF